MFRISHNWVKVSNSVDSLWYITINNSLLKIKGFNYLFFLNGRSQQHPEVLGQPEKSTNRTEIKQKSTNQTEINQSNRNQPIKQNSTNQIEINLSHRNQPIKQKSTNQTEINQSNRNQTNRNQPIK